MSASSGGFMENHLCEELVEVSEVQEILEEANEEIKNFSGGDPM